MLKAFHGFACITFAIAGACATIPTGNPAVTVDASAETTPVGTINQDAADDPAIWRNADQPSKSLIVGTDKVGGLYVYALSGEELFFLPAKGLNNVDLVEMADGKVLVAASDRSDRGTAYILVATLDTSTGALSETTRIAVGPGEGYGICVGDPTEDGAVIVYSAPKNGIIYQTVLSKRGKEITGQTEQLASVPSQPEGCVADPRTDTLYVGEELAGIWAIDTQTGDKEMVAPVGTGMTVPDVEGLALAPEGQDGGYLVASSQGDNAFAVYGLPGHQPIGRFRIAKGAFGSVEETDGIELDPRSFGPDYPGGLLVVQDGVNPPNAQNFKMVRWDRVLESLDSGGVD